MVALSDNIADINIANGGFLVRLLATAAGVTKRANIRSTPTTLTAIETVIASRTIKNKLYPKLFTPLASATSSSIEENSSGL